MSWLWLFESSFVKRARKVGVHGKCTCFAYHAHDGICATAETHGEDVPEPPIVVLLRGQLLLAGVVQHEELLGQDLKLRVTNGTELHLRTYMQGSDGERQRVLACRGPKGSGIWTLALIMWAGLYEGLTLRAIATVRNPGQKIRLCSVFAPIRTQKLCSDAQTLFECIWSVPGTFCFDMRSTLMMFLTI